MTSNNHCTFAHNNRHGGVPTVQRFAQKKSSCHPRSPWTRLTHGRDGVQGIQIRLGASELSVVKHGWLLATLHSLESTCLFFWMFDARCSIDGLSQQI